MNARRVNLQRRDRVVSAPYCPRCLSRTERTPAPPVLRFASRLLRLPLRPRDCAWCGWSGVQLGGEG